MTHIAVACQSSSRQAIAIIIPYHQTVAVTRIFYSQRSTTPGSGRRGARRRDRTVRLKPGGLSRRLHQRTVLPQRPQRTQFTARAISRQRLVKTASSPLLCCVVLLLSGFRWSTLQFLPTDFSSSPFRAKQWPYSSFCDPPTYPVAGLWAVQ